jgi:hypothetical protein
LVLLTYLRASCLLLFDVDLVGDPELMGSLSERILPHWNGLCKSIAVADTDPILGDLRLTFVDFCAVIGDEGHSMDSKLRDAILTLFEWFLLHASTMPTIDDLRQAITLVASIPLAALGSISKLLHKYHVKVQERSEIAVHLPFMRRFLDTDDPMFVTNGPRSFLPLFVESASQCIETGELAFDQHALEALRERSLSMWDEFCRSLVVSPAAPFHVIAMDVDAIGDSRLSSSFQLIFRGGFSPHSVAECLSAVMEGGHWSVWKYVIELSFFL